MTGSYDEFVLAQVIADSLDGEYDDENDVFTSAVVKDGFRRSWKRKSDSKTPR